MSVLDNPNLPPDALIAILVPTLWTGVMAGRQANVCVDACRMLQHAYGQFGMRSELRAVELEVVDGRGEVIHHAPQPSWEGNVLSGHCIVCLPDDHRFIDATVEQYRRVAHLHFGVVVGLVAEPTTPLHHLDLVALEHDPRAPGPTLVWLNAAHTSRARNNIRVCRTHSFAPTNFLISPRHRQKGSTSMSLVTTC